MIEIDKFSIWCEDVLFDDSRYGQLVKDIVKCLRARGGVATPNRLRCDVAKIYGTGAYVPKGYEDAFISTRAWEFIELGTNGRAHFNEREFVILKKEVRDPKIETPFYREIPKNYD
ncbi:MAG: hypothetical protein KKF56_01335 [Nanoarchaeota archaeon]|nr:hypothetical protein [Nanoarchaeota archaeon]